MASSSPPAAGAADSTHPARATGREWLVFPGFLLLATLVFYRKLVLPDRILADYDVWTYFYPLRTYAAQAIQAGRLPLWNPDTFMGAPFFANPQTAVLYPGTVLFYLLPVPYAYSLSIIVHCFLAAFFAYVLFRRSLGVLPVAATVGAMAFAFGGFLTSQVGHLNQFCATAWMPAVVLATDEAARGRSVRWAVAAGAALAVQLLAGHAQESYLTLWAVAVLLTWRTLSSMNSTRARWIEERVASAAGLGPTPSALGHLVAMFRLSRGAVLIPVGVALLVGGVGFGIAAAQLLPTAELSSHSIRSGGMTYQEGIAFSLPPRLLVRALMPGYWYNPTDENVAYVGATALGLAALGLVFGRSGPARFGAALTMLGVFFALGGANPFYPVLFKLVPGLDLFRVPARWLIVSTLGLASLAAIGVQWMFGPRPPGVSVPRTVGASAFILALAALAVPSLFQIPGRILLLWVIGFAGAALLALLALRWPGRFVALSTILVTFAELNFAGLDLPAQSTVPAEAAVVPREVPAFLVANPRKDRILSVAPVEYEVADHQDLATRYPALSPAEMLDFKSALKLDEVMSPNVPLRYGLSTADGYDGGILPLRRYLTLASLLVPRGELRSDGMLRTRLGVVPEGRFLDLFGVGRVVANRVLDVEIDGVSYDTATPRILQPGARVRVDLEQPTEGIWLGILGSFDPPNPALGQRMGTLTLIRGTGERDEVALRANREVFGGTDPGPMNVPSAGSGAFGRWDTSIRFALPSGSTVTGLEFHWDGPPSLRLRAVTLGSADRRQAQVLLHPDLRRTVFQNLKVYEVTPPNVSIPLIARGEVRDDPSAVELLRAASLADRAQVLALAPASTDRSAEPGLDEPSLFVRVDPPVSEKKPDFRERFVYHRIGGTGAGYLVVDDAWFPGWRAFVDGIETPVERANVHFKAVWIPTEAQTVELAYLPTSVRQGVVVSIGALLVAFILFVRGRLL